MLSILNEAKIRIFQQEQLTVRVFPSIQEIGSIAAEEIGDQICHLSENRPEINMIFVATPSRNEFLSHLVHDRRVDWIRINVSYMDKYIGMHPEVPQDFEHLLRTRIFDEVPFKEVNYLDGLAENPEEECQRYTDLLTKHPVNVVCLGTGEDGHIALNGPDVADFSDPKLVRVVELDLVRRQQRVNGRCFKTLDLVSKETLTLTISALLKAG